MQISSARPGLGSAQERRGPDDVYVPYCMYRQTVTAVAVAVVVLPRLVDYSLLIPPLS